MMNYKLYETNIKISDDIKSGYVFAKENEYTHFVAVGTGGCYGWDISANKHIPIESDKSQCQELSSGNIVYIKSLEVIESNISEEIVEPNILSDETSTPLTEPFNDVAIENIACAQNNIAKLNGEVEYLVKENKELQSKLDCANSMLLEEDAIKAELVNKISELENLLNDERSAVIAMANKTLSLEEYLDKPVHLPKNTIMEIEVKKTYVSAENDSDSENEMD